MRDFESRFAIRFGSSQLEAEMMDQIFDWCVNVLIYWADVLGITYKEINVWVFVIIWPIVTIIMGIVIIWQAHRIRQLSGENDPKHK